MTEQITQTAEGDADAAKKAAAERLEKTERHIARLLADLPKNAGVYQFKDESGTVIYVGKAKNLRNRVRTYFQKVRKESPKTEIMRRKIVDIELITVSNEIEALILETTLIKQLRPKYNVLMRDDKNFLYVKITLADDYPEIYTVRRMMKDGARYFGPYTSAESIRQTLKILQKIFPYRGCNGSIAEVQSPPAGVTALPLEAKATPIGKEEYRTGVTLVKIKGLNRTAPCLDYHIKRCCGPCIGAITSVAYHAMIDSIILFLSGKTDAIIQVVKERMQAAVQNRAFEEAGKWRDQLHSLESVLEKQQMVSTTQESHDVIAIARDRGMGVANVFQVRNGHLIGRQSFPLKIDEHSDDSENGMERFLTQYYSEAAEIPATILVAEENKSFEIVAQYLSQLSGSAVHIAVPQRGDKRRLIELATQNAERALEEMKVRWMTDEARTKGALKELRTALQVASLRRIECYDISHIQGTDTVASMVVFHDGIPTKAHYRRFKIKQLREGQVDDFASMMEVLERRLRKIAASIREREKALQEAKKDPSENTQHLEAADAEQPINQIDELNRSNISIEQPDTVPSNPEPEENKSTADSFTEIPDLIILDGGKGQLSSVMKIVRSLQIENILSVVALAKQEEELFIPEQSAPLVLPRDSNALFLVQRIRDEAHRFALSYHQHLRSKKMIHSVLDDIPGIGSQLKKKLLTAFGSVAGIRAASDAELEKIVGKKAAKIREML